MADMVALGRKEGRDHTYRFPSQVSIGWNYGRELSRTGITGWRAETLVRMRG